MIRLEKLRNLTKAVVNEGQNVSEVKLRLCFVHALFISCNLPREFNNLRIICSKEFMNFLSLYLVRFSTSLDDKK